jgi:hypothetical protein
MAFTLSDERQKKANKRKEHSMFNAKKINDKVVITKSVLPTEKPTLDPHLQELADQLARKNALLNKSEPSKIDVSNRKALLAEMKPYADKLTMADYNESPEVIRAKMAVIRAQEDYTVLQVKSKNAMARSEIEKQIYANTNRVSTAEVFYLPTQGYYICYDTFGSISKVFIRKDSEPTSAKFNILVHRRASDASKGSPNVVIQQSIEPLVDLSKQEFMDILNGKPAYEDLCKVYRLAANGNVSINIDKLTPVY